VAPSSYGNGLLSLDEAVNEDFWSRQCGR